VRVFFFEIVEMIARKHDGFVDGNRQPSMPPTEHYCAKDELTQRVPRAAKAISFIWETNGDSNCSIT
jgi:hypothetical protein